ncbi:MAG: hypothetical protein A2W35_03410 [Chloroflexi bacterium RBG_16_57_11]|nr:MAG: hypothetical protein A2W35_03410 [Chloroflexi bacterium RBG_16_57_11]
MDIFFADPSEVPLPPSEVRIRELNVDPWPDGRRLRVYLEVDPFQKRPNVDLTLVDQDGRELSGVSIIESMTRKMELVMHLRGAIPGTCTLQALLYYAALPEPAEPGGGPGPEPKIERKIIDTRQVTFELSA